MDFSPEDPGDLDDARPEPVSLLGPNDFMEPGDNLLEGCVVIASSELFDLIDYHAAMRSCCHHCAIEACGEDGS